MQNLGIQTDLKILGTQTRIENYKSYLCVQTPECKTYKDGNFILLNNAPTNSNKKEIENAFYSHFKENGYKYIVFKWDGDKTNHLKSFIEDGYEYEINQVLSLNINNLNPPSKSINPIEFQPLSEEDLYNWNEIEIEETKASGEYRSFLKWKSKNYWKKSITENGIIYGAYRNQKLIATAGLFIIDKIGRFQEVRTIHNEQRKGVASNLISHILVVNKNNCKKFVIVAEKDSNAQNIYERLGFRKVALQSGISKARDTGDIAR